MCDETGDRVVAYDPGQFLGLGTVTSYRPEEIAELHLSPGVVDDFVSPIYRSRAQRRQLIDIVAPAFGRYCDSGRAKSLLHDLNQRLHIGVVGIEGGVVNGDLRRADISRVVAQ